MKRLIKKYLVGGSPYLNMNKEEINKAVRTLSSYGLKTLSWLGEKFNSALTSGGYSDMGQTSPFSFSSGLERRNIHTSRSKAVEKTKLKIAENSVYISPSSYIAAITQGSINPKVGAEVLSRLSPEVLLLAAAGDIYGLSKIPKVKTVSSTVDNILASRRKTKIGKALGGDAAAGRVLGRQLGLNVKNIKLGLEAPILGKWLYSIPVGGIPENSSIVRRTGAMNFNSKVKRGEISLEDPNTAVIEIKSTPEGEATVKQRHMYIKDKDGNPLNIAFSYNEADAAKYPDRLLQLIFDDSHPKSGYITKLTEDLVRLAIALDKWKGTPIAANPRAITFTNISPTQAMQAIDFFDANKGNNIWVHCLQGKSRSGAYDKFLRDMYGYQYPEGATVDMYSPEVYKALKDAYSIKHGTYDYFK